MPISRWWRLQRIYRDNSKPIAPDLAVKWDKKLEHLYLILTGSGLIGMIVYLSFFHESTPDYADPIDRSILQGRKFGNKEAGVAIMYKTGEGFTRREYPAFEVSPPEILEAERQEHNRKVRAQPSYIRKMFGPL